MSGNCRKSPIGRKSASVNLFPDDPTQLELVEMVVTASQDRSWTGTMVTAQLTCPGLRLNFNQKIPNGTPTTFHNAAGVAVGHFKGTARFSWPNGQNLVINFEYDVKR